MVAEENVGAGVTEMPAGAIDPLRGEGPTEWEGAPETFRHDATFLSSFLCVATLHSHSIARHILQGPYKIETEGERVVLPLLYIGLYIAF